MASAELSNAISARLVDVRLTGAANRSCPDVLDDLLEDVDCMATPELRTRIDQECRFFRDTGYAPAIAELIRIGQEFGRVGHSLHVEGAAAGSAVLHLAGLTPLDPVEHGLLTERFIDIGRDKEAAWPWADTPIAEPDYFAARVSAGVQDALLVLRRCGYAFGVTADTIPGLSCSITAVCREGDNEASAVHLVFTASSVAALSNFLGTQEQKAAGNDVQTWHLLAAGATAGIEPLDSDVIRSALRSRKPKSLADLTDVLAITRMGLVGDAVGGVERPVYQEDLMRLLSASLGLGLRDAYELVRTLGNPMSPHVARVRECFFNMKPPAPLSPREWNQLWYQLVEDCPVAVCKANYLATAYHCLQAAYLKAHHPAEFRAVLEVATT